MAAQFGGLAISFRQLLHNLEHLCGCTVALIGPGGIPDPYDESASGDFYRVTRSERPDWYADIEVFHYELPVLQDHLETICIQLHLPVERVLGKRLN